MNAILRTPAGWIGTLLTGLCWLAPLLAQTPTAPGTPPAGGAETAGAPVFPMVVAFAFTVVILLIVCMPSRKG